MTGIHTTNMRIRIHTPVEFEKIIPHEWSQSIPMTRQRLTLQQMLDSGDNKDHLVRRTEEYLEKIQQALTHVANLGQEPLIKQPIFQWHVNQTIVSSPCWRFETIMPNVLLAHLHKENALGYMKSGLYKDAHSEWTSAKKHYTQCKEQLKLWTWKLPELNYSILQKEWHISHEHLCDGFLHLATLSVGIEKETSSKVLYTVSQRAVRSFAASIKNWSNIDVPLHLAEVMRYYYSADMLWDAELYGASIYRLKTWVHQQPIDSSIVPTLEKVLEQVPDLIQERVHMNEGAFFDLEKATTPLPGPETLIHKESTDMPHPLMSRDSVSQDASHTDVQET